MGGLVRRVSEFFGISPTREQRRRQRGVLEDLGRQSEAQAGRQREADILARQQAVEAERAAQKSEQLSSQQDLETERRRRGVEEARRRGRGNRDTIISGVAGRPDRSPLRRRPLSGVLGQGRAGR